MLSILINNKLEGFLTIRIPLIIRLFKIYLLYQFHNYNSYTFLFHHLSIIIKNIVL